MDVRLLSLLQDVENFNNNYHVYNIEKENYTVYYSVLISCISPVILSKKLFKRNKEVMVFLEKHFDIQLPLYLQANRSLILGRAIKHFSQINDINELKQYLDTINSIYKSILSNKEDGQVLSWSDLINNIELRG